MYGAVLIEKEKIKDLKFVEHEVLKTEAEREHRRNELLKATTMGNTDHTKVKIVFETEEGRMEVETTIWASTEDFILLKGDTQMPVKAIFEVIIY